VYVPTVGRWDLHGDDVDLHGDGAVGGSSADLLSACNDDDAIAAQEKEPTTKTYWNTSEPAFKLK